MKCPFCGCLDSSVIDSRLGKEALSIRRRRHCENKCCEKRFTTYERIEELMPMVVKKDGRRESFDRSKIQAGLTKACEKRPISKDQIEKVVDEIEHAIREHHESEVSTALIGETIMTHLKLLDPVAYVRFASVYRSFQDVGQFVNEIHELAQHKS